MGIVSTTCCKYSNQHDVIAVFPGKQVGSYVGGKIPGIYNSTSPIAGLPSLVLDESSLPISPDISSKSSKSCDFLDPGTNCFEKPPRLLAMLATLMRDLFLTWSTVLPEASRSMLARLELGADTDSPLSTATNSTWTALGLWMTFSLLLTSNPGVNESVVSGAASASGVFGLRVSCSLLELV